MGGSVGNTVLTLLTQTHGLPGSRPGTDQVAFLCMCVIFPLDIPSTTTKSTARRHHKCTQLLLNSLYSLKLPANTRQVEFDYVYTYTGHAADNNIYHYTPVTRGSPISEVPPSVCQRRCMCVMCVSVAVPGSVCWKPRMETHFLYV